MDELKKRQIGALKVGDLFQTIHTARTGVVLELYDLADAGIKVQFDGPLGEIRILHPEVRVYA